MSIAGGLTSNATGAAEIALCLQGPVLASNSVRRLGTLLRGTQHHVSLHECSNRALRRIKEMDMAVVADK